MKTTSSNCFLIFLITIFCGVICVTAQTKAVLNADEKNLTALIKQAIDAQASFDAAALDRIYASDYVEISPVGEVDLRDKAIGFYKLQDPKGIMKTTSAADEFSVRNYGNFAIIIARIIFSQTGNEMPARALASFRATYVCRKEKGKWKISSVQVTGIRRPRPPQTK
jgi:uncharacterized protein (TIGR02246 family)